jgi:hypothetical protein
MGLESTWHSSPIVGRHGVELDDDVVAASRAVTLVKTSSWLACIRSAMVSEIETSRLRDTSIDVDRRMVKTMRQISLA